MKNSERKLGIDLLRIICMILVICHHILVQGGLIEHTAMGSLNYYVASFLNMLAYCGVNCFVLISGYVGCKARFKLSRIVKLWLSVVFWSVVISCVFFVTTPEKRTIEEAISMFLPILRGRYWFFTAYFIVFMFSPILNHLINTLSQSTYRKMLIAVFAVFCMIPVLALGYDTLRITEGFEFSWLMVVYLIGGYLRRFPLRAIKTWKWLIGYIGFGFVHILFKFMMESVIGRILGTSNYGNLFMSYTSPLILGEAICLFMFFAQYEIKMEFCKKCIAFAAPSVFSVYIIHCHPLVFWKVLPNLFAGWADLPIGLLCLAVGGIAVVILCVCMLMDHIRIGLFGICKIDSAAEKICDVAMNRIRTWL